MHIAPPAWLVFSLITAPLAADACRPQDHPLAQEPSAPQIHGPGQWRNDGADLVQSKVVEAGSLILFGDPTWSEYDIVVKAMPEQGSHGFKVLYHVAAADTYSAFAVGNYFNKGCDCSYVVAGKWGRAEGQYQDGAIDLRRWYEARVEVRGARVRCFLDGELMFEGADRSFTQGRIGLATWDSAVRFRGLRVTRPNGGSYLVGLPQVPKAAAAGKPLVEPVGGPRPAGDWRVTFQERGKQVASDYHFADAGHCVVSGTGRPAAPMRVENLGVACKLLGDATTERWTAVGERYLVEQWDRAGADLAVDPPFRVGIATRVAAAAKPAAAPAGAGAGKPRVADGAARRTFQDQSRRHFEKASRPWGGPEFQLTAAGIETPTMDQAASKYDRNSMLLSPTVLGAEAALHCELQGKNVPGTLVGLVFGAKDAKDCYIVDILMNGVNWQIRLYRHRLGSDLQELAKQDIRLQPGEVTNWWDLDIAIHGKQVVIDLGDRAHLVHTATAAVDGQFGVYVSGATTATEPFVLRKFHVDAKGGR